MAPNIEAQSKISEPLVKPVVESAKYGIRAVLFGPPGSGKGTQVNLLLFTIKDEPVITEFDCIYLKQEFTESYATYGIYVPKGNLFHACPEINIRS